LSNMTENVLTLEVGAHRQGAMQTNNPSHLRLSPP
jgi:hypothetical protein